MSTVAPYFVPQSFPHAEQIALIWGSEHQVKYYYAEAIPAWGEGPNLWVLTRLLWDPKQNVDELLDDCVQGGGRSGRRAKAQGILSDLERFWEKDILTSRWYSATNLWYDHTNTMYLDRRPAGLPGGAGSSVGSGRTDRYAGLQGAGRRLAKMWKIYRASVLARQGDELLWKTADLQTDARM